MPGAIAATTEKKILRAQSGGNGPVGQALFDAELANMKFLLIWIFVLCTALPFAFYVVRAALTQKPISPGFLKAYGRLLIAVFGVAGAALDGVEAIHAFRSLIRTFVVTLP